MAKKIMLAARIPNFVGKIDGRQLSDRYDVFIEYDITLSQIYSYYSYLAAIISNINIRHLKITQKNVSELIFLSKDLQLGHTVKFFCDSDQNKSALPLWSLSNNRGHATLENFCLDILKSLVESSIPISHFVKPISEDHWSIIYSDDLRVDIKENLFGAIELWIKLDVQIDRIDKLTDLMRCIEYSRACATFRKQNFVNKDIIRRYLECSGKYSWKMRCNIPDARQYCNQDSRNNYFSNSITRDKANWGNESEQSIITFGKPSSEMQWREWIANSYDPVFEKSRTFAHLSLRSSAAVVAVGGEKVMIVSGYANGEKTSSVVVLCCQKRQTHLIASINVARCSHGACSVGDAVVVCGGSDERYNCLNSCEVYSEDRWKLLPEMMEARQGVAVVSSPDGCVFAIGGHNGNDCLSSVEFCRLSVDCESSVPPSARFWRSLAPMRKARYLPAAVFFQENLFVAGGINAGNLNSVERLNIANETAQWISMNALMQNRRAGFSLLIYSQEIFAFGENVSSDIPVERLQFSRNTNSVTASSCDFFSETSSCFQWESLFPISSMVRVIHAVVISQKLHELGEFP